MFGQACHTNRTVISTLTSNAAGLGNPYTFLTSPTCFPGSYSKKYLPEADMAPLGHLSPPVRLCVLAAPAGSSQHRQQRRLTGARWFQ